MNNKFLFVCCCCLFVCLLLPFKYIKSTSWRKSFSLMESVEIWIWNLKFHGECLQTLANFGTEINTTNSAIWPVTYACGQPLYYPEAVVAIDRCCPFWVSDHENRYNYYFLLKIKAFCKEICMIRFLIYLKAIKLMDNKSTSKLLPEIQDFARLFLTVHLKGLVK